MQMVQRAFHLLNGFGTHVGIYFGRFRGAVPQKRLNVAQVSTSFQQMRGKAVAERMQGHSLLDAC